MLSVRLRESFAMRVFVALFGGDGDRRPLSASFSRDGLSCKLSDGGDAIRHTHTHTHTGHIQPLSRLDLHERTCRPSRRCYELRYRYDARFFRPRCTILSLRTLKRNDARGMRRTRACDLGCVREARELAHFREKRAPPRARLRASARIFFYLRKPVIP